MCRWIIGKDFSPDELENWDYLGNKVVNSNLTRNQNFFMIDRDAIQALPENRYCKDIPSLEERYRKFYFDNTISAQTVLDNNQGILCLHNSWTPEKYRQMSINEFLKQDITLAGIFKSLFTGSELLELPGLAASF
jgi:hypothetical protein